MNRDNHRLNICKKRLILGLFLCSFLIFSLLSTLQHTLAEGRDAHSPSEEQDTLYSISGLRFIDYVQGEGKLIEPGMKVEVDYAGYLEDGTLFDTSIDSIGQLHEFDRGGYPFKPLSFIVGEGRVIQGWDEGLTLNMRVGGKRRLIIPPHLGYGSTGAGNSIPPNATLIFDVLVREANASEDRPPWERI